MPSKRTFGQFMTPDGTPESSHGYTGSTPPINLTSPSAPTPKRQCHDARAVNAKPGHSPDNLFGTVPKKPIIELPRPARTSAEVRVQLVGHQTFRRVHIPSNYTFIHLHHLMLFLFGWSGVHAHRFSVQNNIIMHELRRGHIGKAPVPGGLWFLTKSSVRQRSEEALTIGEVFGAHVCRRGRAIIYEYDPNHTKGFKVHITLIDLVQHDEPDQLSSPPAWPALPPLPPSSPIRSIASSPYTPRGRQLSLDIESSPVRSLGRSRSMPSMTFDDEDEDLPQRPPLGADRTNNPWIVVGQGVSPPERELAVTLEEDTLEESHESRTNPNHRGKARKEAGLSLRNKCIELDIDLFNDGPDGEEGTCFARWLSGELVVEREGNILLVRDRTRALTRAKEGQRAKSMGWDSDGESPDEQGVDQAVQGPVTVEPLDPPSDQVDELEDEEPEEPAGESEGDEEAKDVNQCEQDEDFWDDM
ncbi:hypothetical protein OPQ81_001089 [Rhizoctonia solani]|nr:hypothetical protein OPQ81_001089 [Rhizoctonia solani]